MTMLLCRYIINVMYLVNSGFFKSPKLTIDYLEVGKLKINFHLGATK
jgi:hypothetical protein